MQHYWEEYHALSKDLLENLLIYITIYTCSNLSAIFTFIDI